MTVSADRGMRRIICAIDHLRDRGSLYERRENIGVAMRALFEARLKHLGPGDLIKAECVCGHTEPLTAQMLATAGAKPYEVILDLQYKAANAGNATSGGVSIRWEAREQ
jgi:hypothetical protein